MPTIRAVFKPYVSNKPISFRSSSALIKNIVRHLHKTDPYGAHWFLTGETRETSLLYLAFDDNGDLTDSAEAVLKTSCKERGSGYISAWNGELENDRAASLSLTFNDNGWPSWDFDLNYPDDGFGRLGGIKGVQAIISIMATDLLPQYVNVTRFQYFSTQVFQDRPGVGWMLYLPTSLTPEQIPEARALVPAMTVDDKGNRKQIGTIIVSVTDEPFSDENQDHVKIANAIEIRLADQDLLPRFTDL